MKGAFHFADQKLQMEIRNVLREGTTEEKLKAGAVMIQLQKAFTDMLEKYGKKPVMKLGFEDEKVLLLIKQILSNHSVGGRTTK